MKNNKNLKKAKVNGGVTMSLYDLNKNIISQLPPLEEKDIERIKNEINTFDDDNKNLHYMLLCNELHYYTILTGVHIGAAEFSSLGSAIIGLINEMGNEIIAADAFEGRYEIWLRNKDSSEEEPHVYLLSPYDLGVVTYGA
jgi:hypothetical protein